MNAQQQVTSGEITLTEIEAIGLASQFDLANGHASHDLTLAQENIIQQLPAIWQTGLTQKSRDAELMFKHAFLKLACTPSLSADINFKICPTASNSIDVVAAWLAENKLKTALIEPTFDNLYLILKRRGVELTALPEHQLHQENYADVLRAVDAVFLVNPNNPTGKIISEPLFKSLINWCAENKKVMIVDNSFRFFIPQTFDIYRYLYDSGVTFISFEDTGKVWPTQEIKASLLFSSPDIFDEIDIIYDEIFLCHSNFSLGILAAFLTDAHRQGLVQTVWRQVAERRLKFREVLDGNILSVHQESLHSTLSVEWVKINKCLSDMELVHYFQQHQLVLLPGRQFYWNHHDVAAKTDSIRFALLKPEKEFNAAISLFKNRLHGLVS